jgi:hypothetical protein
VNRFTLDLSEGAQVGLVRKLHGSIHRDGTGPMSSVIVLFVLSLVIGLALGRFSWRAIAASSLALAVVAAVALHRQGFGPLAGIAIIVACLTINQAAYLAGIWFVDRCSGNLVPAYGASIVSHILSSLSDCCSLVGTS